MQRFQRCGAVCIILYGFRGAVLGTAQFDDEASFMTVEIYNEAANRLLPVETDGIMRQKIVPEVVFLGVAKVRNVLAREINFLL